jgi:16S rRNA (cytosine967-C5)-methyltransferase
MTDKPPIVSSGKRPPKAPRTAAPSTAPPSTAPSPAPPAAPKRSGHKSDARADAAAGVAARRLAAQALERVADTGAYANLVLPAMLERSDLDARDRGFVTELVYGATRMRRSCDWLVDRFIMTELDPQARAFLRLGAYQLVFLDTPPHAAVSATVDAAPRKLRGLVNAVLRRVAEGSKVWPDDATRLSYPDWIIERLVADLGREDGLGALEAMNQAATVSERDDGYTQDLASQWVADAVEARAGEQVLDVCAAPGGKATRLAHTGASVVAADKRPARAGLIVANAERTGVADHVRVVVADGTVPPFAIGSFDRVLIDAPCSGLGALRRRPDARWRIEADDVEVLAALQVELVEAALPLVRPGGMLVYSVCTLTDAESLAIDHVVAGAHPELVAAAPLPSPFRPVGRGARLLPQDAGTDGMYVLRLQLPG